MTGRSPRTSSTRSCSISSTGRRTGVSQVSDVVHQHEARAAHGSPPPPRRGVRRFTGPGYVRAAWMASLFWGIGLALVVFFRWLGGYDPTVDWPVVTVVASLTTAPIGFLAGIGAF